MKPMIKIFFLSILISFAIVRSTMADDQIPADRTIDTIHTYDTFAAVRFSPGFSSTLGCPGDPGAQDIYVVIDFSVNKDAKMLYATILAAYMTGKNVGFGVNVCSLMFAGGVPQVYRVDIQ